MGTQAQLTAVERDLLLRAWPWPSEAATTADGFGGVVAAVEEIVQRRFVMREEASFDWDRLVAVARHEALPEVGDEVVTQGVVMDVRESKIAAGSFYLTVQSVFVIEEGR